MSKIIRKPVSPAEHQAVEQRVKNFAVQPDDRNIQVGDTLVLMEWRDGNYTETRPVWRKVKYVDRKNTNPGIADGFCIVGW